MNETIILRKRVKIPCQSHPDLLGYKNVYFRTGYDDLLFSLLNHPRAIVGIYSSMVYSNIQFCVDGMLRNKKLEPFKERFTLIFDKQYNSFEATKEKAHSTIRDLEKIWADPRCSSFNETNTIVIDNDMRKVKKWKKNAIVVNSFAAEHLIERKPNNYFYLNELKNYLINVLDNYDGDVRKQLISQPFEVNADKYNSIDPGLPIKIGKELMNSTIEQRKL